MTESGEIEEHDQVPGTERGNVGRWKEMTESPRQKEKTEGRGEDKDSGGYLRCQKWRKIRIRNHWMVIYLELAEQSSIETKKSGSHM